MAVYRHFLDSSTELQIDVDEAAGVTAAGEGYMADLVEAVTEIARRTAEQLAELSERRPSEVTLAFALTALGVGGFAIARGDAAANFRISMRWDLSNQGGEGSSVSQLTGGMAPR